MSSSVELQEQKQKERAEERARNSPAPHRPPSAAPSPSPSPASAAPSPSALAADSPASDTLLLGRLGQYPQLCAYYRQYLTTHLESSQVWYLLSLALLSSHQYDECLLALRECLKRSPFDVPALLLAS